jgi:hypothetical protein
MMLRTNHSVKKDIIASWPELFLFGFIFSMAFVYIRFSSTRYFNFDEFEALYAGASLLRGKTLYADRIEPHFPLFNMCMAYLIGLFGSKAAIMLIARYFMQTVNIVAMIFIYKIGEMAWDKRAGLLAVCFTLSSVVFFTKGIEIRHDVFNMAFHVIGAYYGLKYIKGKHVRSLILSGIFLGMALASTQKAVVSSSGIIIGLWMYYIRDKTYRPLVALNCCYLVTLLAPLAIAIACLMLRYGEEFSMFLKYAVATQVTFYAPFTEELYHFPYSRYELFKDLIFQNHLLYALAIGGLFANLMVWFRSNTERIVIALWALAGLLFYITAKRPFFQSFLPSIPPLSLLAAGFFSEMFRDLKALDIHRRIGIGVIAIGLLFMWPLCLVYNRVPDNPRMMRQAANVSYCLDNLREEDKVLCFTFNQIFFDPVLDVNYYEKTDRHIRDYGADWFERRMIEEQCKVVINDYRTRLLRNEVKERIQQNYIATKTGDILVPGFVIPPGKFYTKMVWIAGDYYSPTRSLEVDGVRVEGNLIHLDQKEHSFHNVTDRYVSLVYIFDKTEILNKLPIKQYINGKQ